MQLNVIADILNTFFLIFKIFQNRYNGRVDFERRWTEYVEGFGNPVGEYRSGKNIYLFLVDVSC